MNEPSSISPARPDEWTTALALALQHVPESNRPARIANALTLLESGDIHPQGVFVARHGKDLVGVQVCIPLAGAGGLFWLPQVESAFEDGDLSKRLVETALDWLQRRGAKLAQALIHPRDLPCAVPLIQGGFRHVTQLQYLRHDLEAIPGPQAPSSLHMEPLSPSIEVAFQEALLRTYEGSLDCPELNGVRTMEEVLQGHRAQGIFRPETWWLARVKETPAGVVLLTELFEGEGWDLSYVGVAPGFRGAGLGRTLTCHALQAARKRDAAQLLVAVDCRNLPALRLYESLGFRTTESREVFLNLWQRKDLGATPE